MKKLRNTVAVVLTIGIIIGVVSAVSAFETWYVSADALNCRNQPDISTDNILKVYPRGTELQIIGIDSTGKWWQTWDGETQGWCYSSYFASNKEETEQVQYIGGGTYIGTFDTTAYCEAENGLTTSTGATATVGTTIAVDPRVIPYGTRVRMVRRDTGEDLGIRIAQDCGGAIKGNRIDIFLGSMGECNAWGHRMIDVYRID